MRPSRCRARSPFARPRRRRVSSAPECGSRSRPSRARARRTGRGGRTRRGRAPAAACAAPSRDAGVVNSVVAVGPRNSFGVGEIVIELDARRHRRRAAVPRHDERAAGVGVARSKRRRSSPRTQPDRNPAENASPAPSTFSTSTVTPLAVERVVERSRNRAVDHRAAHRPALDDERRRRHAAHRGQRRDDVGVAAGDREFLLGADHEIEQRQDRRAGAPSPCRSR